MPSPFPGMNPYLEQRDAWHDFRQRLVPRIADELTRKIRPKYLAKIDENVYIHELSADERFLLGRPDVSVLENESFVGTPAALASLAAPVYGHVSPATDKLSEPFIEIRDTESRELITAIELLSPTNKSNPSDREQYIAKRRRILASSAHLVEIDLLRGGPRMPTKKLPDCDYVVMVSRYSERPRVGLWPLRLRDRLPEIPIPLSAGDADVVLDLQAVLHAVYDAAGYANYIYRHLPEPPLHPADAKWAEDVIAGRGDFAGTS